MKRTHSDLQRKILSFILVLFFLVPLLPMSAFADSWTPVAPKPTDYHYYWSGDAVSPQGTLSTLVLKSGDNAKINKYLVKSLLASESSFALWTYCSDFANAPQVYTGPDNEGRLYNRIPLESVTRESDFFKSTTEEQFAQKAAQLRSILLYSDLWATTAELSAASSIPNLTKDEIVSATQIAIWTLVNNIQVDTKRGAMTNTNVDKYVAFLLSRPGTTPDAMANINVTEVTKLISGFNYQVTLLYAISGLGVDPSNVPSDINATATYTLAGQAAMPISISEHTPGKLVVKNIPIGAQLDVTLSGAQEGVKSVYLFAPKGGRTASQTLVSVDKSRVPLETAINVTSPGNLVNVSIIKDWKLNSADGVLLPNTVVSDDESVFRFTYYGGGFDGLQVIDDVTIKGNASFTSPSVFEAGKAYKVEEVSVNGQAPAQPSIKYFKVNSQNTVVWTDASGAAVPAANAHRFANVKVLETGSVKVVKALHNGLGKNGEAFKFSITWQSAPGAQARAYSGEAYELYEGVSPVPANKMTDANGQFTLTGNQTAVFKNIPASSVITVTELENGQSVRYTMDTAAKQAVIPMNGEQKVLTFTNAYLVGSLTLTKSFGADSALSWDAFPDKDNALQFVVSGGDGYQKTVKLYRGHTSETLTDLPIGNYSVQELNADKTGYELTTTPANGIINGTMTSGASQSALITNTYRQKLGSLTIEKEVLTGSGLSSEQLTAIGQKSFIFDITGPNGYTKTVTLPNNGVWKETLSGLVPGTYTVKERDTGIEVTLLNLTVSFNGSSVIKGADGWSGSVTVKDKETATAKYTNNYSKQTGKLKVIKAVTGDLNTQTVGRSFSFSVTGPDSYTTSFSLPENGNWFKELTGLTPGSYTVTETGSSDIANYTLAVSGSGATASVANNGQSEATVTNKYTRQKGAIQFKKLVTGLDSGDTFSFTVRVDGALYSGSYTVNSSSYSTTNGIISGIKHNDVVTIAGLPAGASVIVTETANTSYTLDSITGGAVNLGSANSTVSVPNNQTAGLITFTNLRKTLSLEIEKLLSGATWDNFPNGIDFEITGPTGWTGATGLTFVSGTTYKFTLTKAKTSITLTGLPAGVYTVKELTSSAELTGYTRTTTYVLGSGSSQSGATATGTLSSGSKLTFTNSYALKVGKLKVTKKLDSYGDPDKIFSFTVTFGTAVPATATVTGADSFSWSADRKTLTFTLKGSTGGKSVDISGIPAGTTYAVTEQADSEYDPSFTNQIGTVSESGTVTVECTNKRKTTGIISVKKIVSGTDVGDSFTFTVKVNNTVWANKDYTVGSNTYKTSASGTFTLKNGETATFSNVPIGVSFSFAETTNNNYTTTSSDTSGTVTTATKTALFTNTHATGTLTVKKNALAGNAAAAFAGQSFTFKIARGSTPLSGQAFTLANPTGSGITSAQGTFALLPGQTATFASVLAGQYAVTEESTGLTIPADVSFTLPAAQSQSITASVSSISFEFTNTFTYKTGSLNVKKTVVTNGVPAWETFPDSGASYEFTLYRVETGGNVPAANQIYTIQSGQPLTTDAGGKFTLKASETAKFTGLLVGTYLVVETTPQTPTSYQLVVTQSPTDASASVTLDSTPTITVTNTYTRQTGDLTVNKTVNAPASSGFPVDKSFTFTLYAGSIAPANLVKNHSAADSATTNADGQFLLGDGETAVFKGLPTGTYVVVESNQTVAGFIRVDAGAPTTLSGATGSTLSFVNTYTRQTGSLLITKAIGADDELGATTWSYDFTVIGPADWTGSGLTPSGTGGYTVTLTSAAPSLLLSDLPGGMYTVSENSSAANAQYRLSTTVNGGTGSTTTLSVGGTVAEANFVNTYVAKSAGFELQKDLGGDLSGQDLGTASFIFTLTGPADWTGGDNGTNVLTITLNASGLSYINNRLPIGTYSLTELTPPDITRFTYLGTSFKVGQDEPVSPANRTISFEVTDQTSVSVICENSYSKDGGILRVAKAVDGYASPQDVFSFQIAGDSLSFPISYTIDGLPGSFPTGQNGEFSLSAGQVATFTGLDTLETYTVTEIGVPPTYTLQSIAGESFQYTIIGGNISDVQGSAQTLINASASPTFTATMGDKSASSFPGLSFVFTNKRLTGGLDLTKQISGPEFDAEDYVFYVTFSDNGAIIDPSLFLTASQITGGVLDTQNKRVVLTLKAGQTGSIEQIPAGIGYKITENPGNHYYTPGFARESGVIADQSTSHCVVTNTRRTGALEITKNVFSFDAENINADETFAVKVLFSTAGLPWPEDILDGYFTVSGAPDVNRDLNLERTQLTVNFSVKHDSFVSIAGIPVGTTYSLSEDLTPDQQLHYSPWILGADGVVNSISEDTSKLRPEVDVISLQNYDIPFNSIVLTKSVIASPGSPLLTAPFEFTLKLFQPEADTPYIQWAIEQQLAKLATAAETLTMEQIRLAKELAEIVIDQAACQQALDTLRLTVDENGSITAGAKALIPLMTCPTCTGATTVLEPCGVCGGDGLLDEDGTTCSDCVNGNVSALCGECLGAGQVEDIAAIDQAVQDALEAYNLDPAVIEEQRYASVAKELQDVVDKINRIDGLKDTLDNGQYVDYNSDFQLIPGSLLNPAPFNLSALQALAAYSMESGQRVDLTLSDINFTQTSEYGVYTFTLANNQYLSIGGLPLGTTYVVEEKEPQNTPEAFEGCDIESTNGDMQDALITEGGISSDETGSPVFIRFINRFADALGKLNVVKKWTSGSGSNTSITVYLVIDGVLQNDRHIELTAQNQWTGWFDGLALGHTYGVVESLPTGYTVTYSPDVKLEYQNKDEASVTVTNKPEKTTPPGPEPEPEPEPEPNFPDPEIPVQPPAIVPEEPELPDDDEFKDDIPLGDLPYTGGFNLGLLGLIGSGLTALGVLLGKKKST